MANLKYNEFASSSWNPAKILLQADNSDGSLEKVFLPDVIVGSTAAMSFEQVGAADPTLDIFQNNIGTIDATRVSAGYYQVTSGTLFTLGKTLFTPSIIYAGPGNPIIYFQHIDTSTIDIKQLDPSENPIDDIPIFCLSIQVLP